ncbi:glycosyltransferase family 2 protein [Natrononativus amylolyticus]|uniref:glycosyltransferase family 2 protein n=1 Tax=Natrononativus amylolyticus TaxID=2963434 RepID=UPI0020CDD3F6|nr:glycosyltransferase [Natrononativus amylolyticus]
MKLSVVVSTLNGREPLLACLDALRERTPARTEVVVVNGPSSDGTTGAVRDRDDVDVLVEISERNPNVSRNAGIANATGDVIAFLRDEYAIRAAWYEAIETAAEAGADVVTGPVSGEPAHESDPKTSRSVGGRTVASFDGDNVALSRAALEALDGFDEYLVVGGARDCAHRLGALEFDVTWSAEMAVRRDVGTDGGRATPDWGDRYRSLAYRLAKNYGPRPTAVARTAGSALRDGLGSTRAVVTGEATPTGWFGNGTAVLTNALGGFRDGLRARYRDRTERRNPNGVSARRDRAVRVYDRR